ncbi:hypothetical protein NITGR_450002 [Nitrospina gracilis 3/211]|uniref:Uncharacterized protein n=1 Tax=Nitrospina gracilis (strain 3/211) TaxID=1266370 RepID=M1YYS3_NITG3|nr:hypothetical protein NITGR_450002 [Nitrospina gracilis 3/211]
MASLTPRTYFVRPFSGISSPPNHNYLI